MSNWIDACATEDIDEEDVIRFDHDGKTFAIYRSPDVRRGAGATEESAEIAPLDHDRLAFSLL